MEVENLFRYAPLCRRGEPLDQARRSPPARARADYFFKDHKPSAIQDEARLRGRERIISSKTISPRWAPGRKPLRGYGLERWTACLNPAPPGYAGVSPAYPAPGSAGVPPARA